MPTSKREALLRKQALVIKYLNKANENLGFLGEAYSHDHPKQEAMIRFIADAIGLVIKLVERFRTEYM